LTAAAGVQALLRARAADLGAGAVAAGAARPVGTQVWFTLQNWPLPQSELWVQVVAVVPPNPLEPPPLPPLATPPLPPPATSAGSSPEHDSRDTATRLNTAKKARI